MADNSAALNAEDLVNSIELSATQAVLSAFKAFDDALKTVVDNYPLSSKFQSNARRIAVETRNNLNYRLTTELPSYVANMSPDSPPTPAQ